MQKPAPSPQNPVSASKSISLGSLAELETHLTIAGKLKYLAQDRTDNILGQTNLLGKRIRRLQKSLQDKAA